MKAILRGSAMLLVVLLGVAGYAADRLVPYDDFNATHIDPDKWFGVEFEVQPGGTATEAIRQIQDNRLRLVHRGYGKMDADSGRQRNELVLIFRDSAAVTAIKATVQVNDLEATGYPRNPQSTFTRAMLAGRFFSTTPSTPGSTANDVVAMIGIGRGSDATDPPDVLRVESLVIHCADRLCTASSTLHFQDLGPIKRAEMARLLVQWDRENHRFIFQRDDDPEVLAPYTVSDTAPPGIQAKVLDAIYFVPHCTATPRPVAFVDTSFDDVLVNESAALRPGR